ncbi:MAG: hypothetical protein K6E29_06355 [Cyanobacteria bacterium RUI128]|nr:hypothetical protein [Cyanobacteria bacterium RUI128]
MKERDFDNGCFSAGWADEVEHNLTPKQRKDLVTLLLELEDMKQEFNRIAAKKDRLTNLWKFYNGKLVTE